MALRLLCLVATFLVTAGPLLAERLVSPIDVAGVRAARGGPQKLLACKEPPPPQRDLDFPSFYTPNTDASVVDRTNERTYRDAYRPIGDFEKGIVRASDDYVLSRPEAPEFATCVLNWLQSWASADAMLGAVSQQGGYVRKWSLGTVSMAYLKIRESPALDRAGKQQVVEWIRRWAAIVRQDYSERTDRVSRQNNHAYWAGWSVMTAGIVLDDRSHFDWGLERFRNAMRQVADDGTLPLEMARRSRALHYHLFAIPPLVMIAETAFRNGIDLYELDDGALHRLIRRTLSGLDDPAYFTAKSGYEQEWSASVTAPKMAWAAVYHARFPSPETGHWIERYGRLKDTRLGGSMTDLFLPQAR